MEAFKPFSHELEQRSLRVRLQDLVLRLYTHIRHTYKGHAYAAGCIVCRAVFFLYMPYMPYMYALCVFRTCKSDIYPLYLFLICMRYTYDYACPLCMPYMYALYACLIHTECLICMPYMHALYACLICMPYMHALHACLTCMPYMHALYACLICMPYMYIPWCQEYA